MAWVLARGQDLTTFGPPPCTPHPEEVLELKVGCPGPSEKPLTSRPGTEGGASVSLPACSLAQAVGGTQHPELPCPAPGRCLTCTLRKP